MVNLLVFCGLPNEVSPEEAHSTVMFKWLIFYIGLTVTCLLGQRAFEGRKSMPMVLEEIIMNLDEVDGSHDNFFYRGNAVLLYVNYACSFLFFFICPEFFFNLSL